MRFFEWDQRLGVGDALIDSEHRQLIDLINELHDVVHAADTTDQLLSERVASVFNRLIDYVYYHFNHEEQLFSATNYPHVRAHKNEHAIMRERVHALAHDFRVNDPRLAAIELMTLVKEWLIGHIQTVDTKMVPFLKVAAE